MTDRVLVELHSHTRASRDGWMRPADLVRAARARGLHRIAVTDHNTLSGARAAQALAPDLVIVGEEVLTTEGELLGWFVREEVPAGLPPLEAAQRLKAQGAVVALAHPFDTWRQAFRGETLAQLLPWLDAVEGFNARTRKPGANAAARAWAQAHGLPVVSGSDAHLAWEVGRAATLLPPFATADELRQALQAAHPRGRPAPLWVNVGSRLAVLLHRWGRLRLPAGSETPHSPQA